MKLTRTFPSSLALVGVIVTEVSVPLEIVIEGVAVSPLPVAYVEPFTVMVHEKFVAPVTPNEFSVGPQITTEVDL